MPSSTVEHATRRRQITDALLRIAGRDGLRGVSMRTVAGEAGVSLRLVQYYFGTKAQLLRAALVELEATGARRWEARRAALGEPGPRAILRAFLAEALPTDDASRAVNLAFHSYTELFLTDPAFRDAPPVQGPDRFEAELRSVLVAAGGRGLLRPDADDPAAEAATLLLLGHGLGASVLIGQRSVAEATTLWDRQLDRILVAHAD